MNYNATEEILNAIRPVCDLSNILITTEKKIGEAELINQIMSVLSKVIILGLRFLIMRLLPSILLVKS